MSKIIEGEAFNLGVFDLQRFAEVIHGSEGNDHIDGNGRNVQVYGLSGDDTVSARGSNVILIGGSGNDVLDFQDGRATLSGGAGNDTFSLTYSEGAPLEALIEDIDPTNDHLLVNYIGDEAASLRYTVKAHNVVLMDADGNLNITLQSMRPLDVYYDQVGNEYFWNVLRIVNEEREKVGAAPLTLSQDLMNSAAVRAQEIASSFSHTRPDGSSCFSALSNQNGALGENIAAGQSDADDVRNSWMNSPGHRANILKSYFSKIGLGYHYESDSYYGKYWVQMFRSYEYSDETFTLDEMLSTEMCLMLNGALDSERMINELDSDTTLITVESIVGDIDNQSIFGTDGDDIIFNSGSGTTIYAGDGNDSISGTGSYRYLYDGGNDVIGNYSSDVTIQLLAGSLCVRRIDGNDAILSLDNGSLTFKGRAMAPIEIIDANDNPVKLDRIMLSDDDDELIVTVGGFIYDAAGGNDLLINGQYFSRGAGDATLLGGDGNDQIKNIGANVTVRGGAGDDTIDHAAHYIYAEGDGNDVITDYCEGDTIHLINGALDSSLLSNYNSDVILKIGDGSITLKNAADKSITVVDSAGAGFVLDTLVGDNRTAETFQYSGGDILIENYSHDDTLELINTTIDSVMTDGGDLIFGTSDGSLTLKNMTNHAITIKDAAGNTTTQIYGTGYTPQDVMKNYVQASARSMLSDLPAVDEAIKASSHFNSLQEVIDAMVSDCRNAGDADTFLRDYCGIIDDNGDTGAVVGWDAGGLTAKTSETILLEEGDAVYPTDTTFTIRGLTITVPERNTLTEQEQLVVRGFYSWWADNALRLIEESYGLTFDGQSIELMFINDDTASWGHGDPDGVTINMAKTSFDADDKNGNGLDRLFAHELTHVAQWSLDVSKGMPLKYMREGMGDLTAGRAICSGAIT